ncbi:MAG: tRNA epoxyqueuosine(34) reductase QueG [Bacteroidetes bacterium]|nr:tRNA epoxyqueuosine(34) reductase QueG [Bacteroidota bacterium]
MIITNEILIQKAKEIGFDLVGFANADELKDEIGKLGDWLSNGFQAGMSYMERNIEKRKDVRNILSNCKSVISLGLNYYTKKNHSNKNGKGKVSRYAWGVDYHLIIWEKLSLLEKELKEIDPLFESKSYVDTGPVMDKAWAVKAGLGWLGKHTNVINKNIGSWFFLSTILTNYEFEYSTQIPDYCGTCTACIDACPTDAIVREYVVDANKCISYLTIENKNEIPIEYKNKFENWIFGCDICQDVCPWNSKFSIATQVGEFLPSNGNDELNLVEVKNMNEEEFKSRFERSPIKRTKLKGLKRNAEFIT